MEDLVSLIVPVYNVEKYLPKCIESMINQSYKNIEILLINDDSKDNSGIICDEFAKSDSRVRVIHKRNEGVSIARNTGLKIAKGKYIGFIDSDDYISYNMIEILLNNMKKYNAEISICGYRIFDDNIGTIKVSDNEKITKLLSREKVLNLIFKTNKINGFLWNKLFSAKIIREMLLKEDMELCEDLLFTCQLLQKSEKICYTSKSLYNYRKNLNSITSNVSNLFYLDGKCKYTVAYEEIETLFKDNNILTTIQLRHIRTIVESYYLVIKNKYRNRNVHLYTFKFLRLNFLRYILNPQVSIKHKIIYLGIFIISTINSCIYLLNFK